MPRKARSSVGGMCYHVINRGNNRSVVFHKDRDYQRFTEMMGEAVERLGMRVLSWCLMPNHFHLGAVSHFFLRFFLRRGYRPAPV